jgi:2-oxoglutarate ferredoxin oxidoreductase subunit gamma
MNHPSMIKFEPDIAPGGILLVNSSITDSKAARHDIRTYYIDAGKIAEELGNEKVTNMVMLGAYMEITKTVNPETLISQLSAVFGEKKAHLVDLNRRAIAMGADSTRQISQ